MTVSAVGETAAGHFGQQKVERYEQGRVRSAGVPAMNGACPAALSSAAGERFHRSRKPCGILDLCPGLPDVMLRWPCWGRS
jgi:hypothetical protein